MPVTHVLFNGRYLRLCQRGTWEFVERTNPGGAAVIIAVTAAREVLMVEQFRNPIGSKTLEFPAGLVGDENSTEAAAESAIRELWEETGYAARSLEPITGGPSSAGMSTEIQHFFRARGIQKTGEGGGVASEQIVVHLVPIDTIASYVFNRRAEGFAIDPKVYAGIYFLRHNANGSLLPTDWYL
jgi:ADP-ribose pyrophosphatase